MSDELWYYAINNKQMEPVTFEALRQLAAEKRLKDRDMVWRVGMPNWVKAAEITELGFAPLQQLAAVQQPTSHYVAPGGTLSYYSQPSTFQCAGFWIRVAAAFIDGIVMWIPGIVLQLIFLGIFGAAEISRPGTPAWWLQFGSSTTMNWLYAALMESSLKQATLGKMAVGIIVVTEGREPISFGRATGRHFGKLLSLLIFFVGFMMAGWTQKKQALHDILAGTMVIYR